MTSWQETWDVVRQHFGLGNSMILAITNLDPSFFKDAIKHDNIYDATVPQGKTLFYVDNLCHSNGVQCVVVEVAGNSRKFFSKCALLDYTTLHNYILQAKKRIPDATLYLLDPIDGSVIFRGEEGRLPVEYNRTGAQQSCGCGAQKSSGAAAIKYTLVAAVIVAILLVAMYEFHRRRV